MITKAKIGNGEKIAEAIRTNNNRFHKYTRNKRSVGETVISLCGREGKLVAEAAWEAGAAFPSACSPGRPQGTCQKQREVSWRQNLKN